MNNFYLPTQSLKARLGVSEREIAKSTGISRGALRKLLSGNGSFTVKTLSSIGAFFQRKTEVMLVPDNVFPEYSTVAVSMKVQSDGFNSWKLHFMDLVDEFRRTLDPRLVILPPVKDLDYRLKALLASIVLHLSYELGMQAPPWSTKRYFLSSPWFVSECESLKATTIVESPATFRRNNIFVLPNFLERV